MPSIDKILKNYPRDPSRLIDVIRDIQAAEGSLSGAAVKSVAEHFGLSEADVRGVASFYHFFSFEPRGKHAIYLTNSITSVMNGRAEVAAAFAGEAGCPLNGVSADGRFGLFSTACVGMNDQEPAAIIDGFVFTRLTPERARTIVRGLKAGKNVAALAPGNGDGASQPALIRSLVASNIRKPGPVILSPFEPGSALRKAAALEPEQVIEEVKRSGLLGRGGAGFPTGLKWEFCRKQPADRRYVVCNADEGEPGTFKDRVILTENPGLVFEGMAVAGFAIGAEEGLLYLRAEYAYLRDHLEAVLAGLREKNLLGKAIAGRTGFNFDISIRMGAGAYVCGEESALLESAEGKRGEPRDRPPYPVQVGYLDRPTTVNNVETLAAAARVLANGSDWFKGLGTVKSSGTKLLSVSGDCSLPGVYEVEFGLTLEELLKLVGGTNAAAVQVGGPSGTCVPRRDFSRKIAFEDLATGGSVIVFGPERDIFQVVENFMEFFVDESCGRCVPCRVGNRLLLEKFRKIADGRGTERDIREVEEWGKLIKASSRCGLGQTSPNPILTTLHGFPDLYRARLLKDVDFSPEFDFRKSLEVGCEAAGRKPLAAEGHHE